MIKIIIIYENGVKRIIPIWNGEIDINMDDKTATIYQWKKERKTEITQIKSIIVND